MEQNMMNFEQSQWLRWKLLHPQSIVSWLTLPEEPLKTFPLQVRLSLLPISHALPSTTHCHDDKPLKAAGSAGHASLGSWETAKLVAGSWLLTACQWRADMYKSTVHKLSQLPSSIRASKQPSLQLLWEANDMHKRLRLEAQGQLRFDVSKIVIQS